MKEGLNKSAYSKEQLDKLDETLKQIVAHVDLSDYKIPYDELIKMMTDDPFIENKVLTYIDKNTEAPYLKLIKLNMLARDLKNELNERKKA